MEGKTDEKIEAAFYDDSENTSLEPQVNILVAGATIRDGKHHSGFCRVLPLSRANSKKHGDMKNSFSLRRTWGPSLSEPEQGREMEPMQMRCKR